MRNDPKAKRYSVDRIILHPNFSRPSLGNDVAMIKLREPILYSNVIRPICLPESDLRASKLATYRYCVLSGFGRTDQSL